MRALWLEDRRLSLRDIPTPVPPPGEVLVRVLAAGICNTDIELTRGYYPFTGVPGHEFVGIADGKRVVGEINAACHRCDACLRGHTTHCDNRSVLGIINRNGAFAEYLTLPRENLHVVPESVPTEEAVFTEPLAAALEIQQQVRITPDDRVLVVGHGKLGSLIAQTLSLTGCSMLVVGRDDPAPPAKSFDVAIECSGNPAGFAVARAALRPRGTLVMKSTYAGALTVNASSLVVDEITLVGSRCGPFPPALALLAERHVDVRPLLHATYTLDDAIAAFEHAQRPGVRKVLVRNE
ncbi:MAG TPA: alcohol dehydrogenase catalytic domain-containing protein [Thermoanaerobaculia bacterium]|nr:alcohol dehydrogenase catalytic domain-containing protein [Thermoanaerobaculia bacterium]